MSGVCCKTIEFMWKHGNQIDGRLKHNNRHVQAFAPLLRFAKGLKQQRAKQTQALGIACKNWHKIKTN